MANDLPFFLLFVLGENEAALQFFLLLVPVKVIFRYQVTLPKGTVDHRDVSADFFSAG